MGFEKTPIQNDDFNNVFIYVGDAVRWDYIPEWIRNRGVAIKTIGASIHSPTSFASLVTGLHPPVHGVETFKNTIPSDVFSMFDLKGYDTWFQNSVFYHGERLTPDSVDPIYSVLGTQPPQTSDPFAENGQPFFAMERGPGGHAPYGSFEGTGREYFRENGDATPQKIQEDYEETVRNDVELFNKRMGQLKRDGLLEETLVIYTSDHGELLGEGGMLGHNSPILPELVYVPTVFVNPKLKPHEIDDTGFGHVDILPTALHAVNELCQYEDLLNGVPLGNRQEDDLLPCYYTNRYNFVGKHNISFSYKSVWNRAGGYVFPKTNLLQRLLVLSGQILLGPKGGYLRNHLTPAVRSYSQGTQKFGTPEFSQQEGTDYLSSIEQMVQNSEENVLSDESKQRLKDLGYI
ncbi:sulfatase-like hydrolase/transferase [Halobaculum roseum]|uniref:Sulfatase-like hydrolase/transferase n=1 Tax=Halobaculum roseum TaxID=2175149 RepID=A0ABD5MNV5_9EURY|nr:sulfatase-like hydrolase/transferase [Halobaculum roseum]QZY03243.1 sulfatase-like hydrolase/transferase [Halobaculum roseum]